jgi:predicted cupin superfamily sugar epimerase
VADRDADYWVARLGLAAHPEGGHYRETYRSSGSLATGEGTGGYPSGRSFSTAIYYLLRSGEVSRLHRLRSDEVFHHYRGSTLLLHVFDLGGAYRAVHLGNDPERDEWPQVVIPAGCWFGATVEAAGSFALVGCTVAPGFDFTEFELADRGRLVRLYPRQRKIIERLTPGV